MSESEDSSMEEGTWAEETEAEETEAEETVAVESEEEETETEEDSSESTDCSVVVIGEKKKIKTTTLYLETDEDEDSVMITEEAEYLDTDPSYTEVSSEDMSSVSTVRSERPTSTSESEVEEILPSPVRPVPSTSRVQRCSQRCAENLPCCAMSPRSPVPSTSRVQSCFERRAENLHSRCTCPRPAVPSTSRVQRCSERIAEKVPCSSQDCPCTLCFPERKANFVKKNICDACRRNRNCRFENWNFLKDRHASEVSEAAPPARNRKRTGRRRDKENCEPEEPEVASITRQRTEAGDDTNQSEIPMEEPPKSPDTDNSEVIPIMHYYLPITTLPSSLKVSRWLELNECKGERLSPVESQRSSTNQDEEHSNYPESSKESSQDRQSHRSSKNVDEDDEEGKTVNENEGRIVDAEEMEEWIVVDDDGESEEQALSENEKWITIEENEEEGADDE